MLGNINSNYQNEKQTWDIPLLENQAGIIGGGGGGGHACTVRLILLHQA